MLKSQEVTNRLDKISNSYVMDRNDTKVTISRDDFYWLVYGVHELNNKFEALSFSEKELDILVNWGFIASTERPLSDEEKELYFKITD